MRLALFTGFLLVSGTVYGMPSPQDGDNADAAAAAASAFDDVERAAAGAGGGYSSNSESIDPDVLDELFGGGGGGVNQINEGYTPPKNQRVDTTSVHCKDYSEQGFACVPYYECDEYGEIIIDGGPGLIDIRGAFGVNVELDVENSKCPGFLDTCCRHPDFYEAVSESSLPRTPKPTPAPTPTPRPVPLPYRSRCGKHNKNGIGIRIQNYGGAGAGGEVSTQFGEWPHMCAILERKDGKNHYVCGGSVIDSGIILTAAHCVDKKDYKNLKIRCGEWDTQRQIEPAPHQDRDVYDMRYHPGYSGGNLTNDAALLFTDENDPFILGDHLDRICLPDFPDARNSYDWEKCVGTGWGKDEFGAEGEYQVVLKQVEVGLWANPDCQEALRTTVVGRRFKLDPTHLCAGGRGGVDTCKGDGGGPLVCPTGETITDSYGSNTPIYVQAGIVGWGVGCGQEGIPGVYTDVASMMCYIDWATRCVRGESYSAYGDGNDCGRRWVNRQRRAVRNARNSWEGIQANIGGPGKSRTVDRRVKDHYAAEEKWTAAIDSCTRYSAASTDYADNSGDPYGSGSDPYGDDDYDQPDLTNFQRNTKKNEGSADIASKSVEIYTKSVDEPEDKKEEKDEDKGSTSVRFGAIEK